MKDGESFIVQRAEDTLYSVHQGDRYRDYLGPDECLWLIARLLIGAKATGYSILLTKEEHEIKDKRLAEGHG